MSSHATRALFGQCNRDYIPYASPLWRDARGSSSCRDSVSELRAGSCCDASGREKKALGELENCQDVDRLVAEASLTTCLESMCLEYTKKGGCDNTIIGRLFSLSTFR